MLKYFTPKKGKEQHENHAEQHLKDALAKDDAAKGKGKEKERSDEPPSPVLSDEDEHFLEHLVSDEGPAPPLPPRPFLTPQISMESMASSAKSDALPGQDVAVTDKGKGKENEKDKTKKNRFSFLSRNRKSDDKLKPNALAVPPQEADKEKDDISKVLEELNLSAVNNRAFSLSKESQVLVQKFTLVLKDLVNGVPTAYDDLVALIDNANDTLSKNYDHLPSYLKKLIKTLPSKLTGNMAPELLAVAAEAQGLGAAAATGGFSAAAKSMLTPSTLKNLVTKPGAVAGMLRAVMNALKLRWPAFMGTNVLFSLGLFVLLFVFWYCHKRGREVRLEKEENARNTVESDGRIVELEDDAMLPPASGPSASDALGLGSVERSQPTASETPVLRVQDGNLGPSK